MQQQPPDKYTQYQPSQRQPPMQPRQPAPQPPQFQPPMQQWPPQQPQKKSGAFWGIGIALLVSLIMVIAGVATGANNTSTTTIQATQSVDQLTMQPTQTSSNQSGLHSIGEHVISGVWLMTVNSVKTSTGDQYDTPKTGDIYLLINFTAKNTDTSNHDMSPNYFTFRNDQGDTYDLAYISVPSDPRGAVVEGQQLRGDLSYEVPKSLHSFVLQFDPPTDFNNNQIVQWTITN